MLFKKFLFIAFILMIIFSAIEIKAQTAWVDSGSVNLSYPTYKIISFTGIVHAGDSLLTPGFAVRNYEPIYSLAKIMTKADSAKVTITRESSWYSDSWTKSRALWSSNSTLTQEATLDTVRYDPNAIRFKIKGLTGTGGNGDSTVVKFRIVFRRE